MFLFLLLSIPIVFLILNRSFTQGEWNAQVLSRSILKGLFLALAGLLLFWLVRFGLDFSFQQPRMYFYSLVYNGNLSVIIALMGLFILIQLNKNTSRFYRLREYLILWGTFFFIMSFNDALSLAGHVQFFSLFTEPVLTLALWFSLALISDKMERMDLRSRIISLILYSLVLFLLPLLQMLHYYNMELLQFIISLVLLGGSILLLRLEFSARLPYGRPKNL